jgi:hypothetical protein
MNRNRTVFSISLAAAVVASAFAASASATTIDELAARNAAQQARIEHDVAASRMDPLRAAQVEQRAADVYRQQSQMFADATDAQKEDLVQAQRDLAGAIAWAEKHPAHEQANAMDRTHLQVATMRNSEQQHMIAQELANGRLTPAQAATLEGAQSMVASSESYVASTGHETVDAALSVQYAQDLQDYAVKVDPGV